MIARLFIKLYDRISFTFTIALFTTSWSWIASFYGFYFVYATVYLTNGELNLLLRALLGGTGFAIFFHLIHFGMLYKFGFAGLTKSIRIINRNFDNKYIFKEYKNIENEKIEDVYEAVTSLPKINLFAALLYTQLVIIELIIFMYVHTNNFDKMIFIVLGGVFASLIIGYFTFLITEYFIGPYKVRLEQIIFEKKKIIQNKNLLSVRYKSLFMMFLIILSMIILTILIRRSERPLIQIFIFITLSIMAIGLLIFLMINTINIALDNINIATKKLASGDSGLYFPSFADKEFIIFSENYNRAAIEINEIRADLELKISGRTEELSKAYNNLNEAYSQIQADLQMARKIQKSIMTNTIEDIDTIKLFINYYPMVDVGGDIYVVDKIYPGKFRIFLADAIGHGVQAALITMIIKGEYEKVKNFENTGMVLEAMNESFINLYYPLNAFFSCFLIDVDVNKLMMQYSSAGHPNQIHIHNGALQMMKHTGKLVGITEKTTFESVNKKMSPGDKIFMFTDGLFEQFNEKDEIFSEQYINNIIEENRNINLEDLHNKIINELRDFMDCDGEICGSDDITLISAEI